MSLFLEVHQLEGLEPEGFVAARVAEPPPGVCFLKQWVDRQSRKVAFLVEAPDAETLRKDASPEEITELFAPPQRWMAADSIEM
jgi:hypothetical protein